MVEVVSVKALPDYRLQVRFDTSEEKIVDFTPYLKFGAWECLRNPALFASATTKGFAVVWGDKSDIAAEALYGDPGVVALV